MPPQIGIVKPRAHRQLVAAHDASNLGNAQLFDVVQHHYGPMTLAQTVQGGLQNPGALAALQHRTGRRIVAGRRIALLLQAKTNAPAAVPTPLLQQNAVANSVDPGRKLAASLEAVATLEHLLRGQLHQIV